METDPKNSSSDTQGRNEHFKPVYNTVKYLWYIASGSAVMAAWLALFVGGLMVNSSYYRAAVNYGYADLSDWIWVILTFTVSNVAILAFFSGLLGGIISKLRATQGFTVTEQAFILKKDGKEGKSIMVENPFISGVRGMFVFIAILFMQYVSSFNDLGSIGRNTDQKKPEVQVNYEELYKKLSKPATGDTVLQEQIRQAIEEQVAIDAASRSDSALVSRIFVLKDRMSWLRHNSQGAEDSAEMRKIESEIKTIRRSVKPPPDADFSQIGISSFSYFKFAVIVSFLAFIFGYDASRFAAFLGRLPGIKPKDQEPKNG